MRRALAVAVLAAAAVLGPSAAASADPSPAPTPTTSATPSPKVSRDGVYVPPGTKPAPQTKNRPDGSLPPEPNDCRRPPNPGSPHDGLAGIIDEGPATPGTGLYSRNGFGGFAPVIYDPGCPVNVTDLPAGVSAAQKRMWDGPNAATDGLMQTMLVATAVVTQGTRLVVGSSNWWGIFDHVTVFAQFTLAWRLWLAFGLFALAATGLWWIKEAPKGDVTTAARSSSRGAIILCVAGLCMAWNLSVGSFVDRGLAAFYQATGDVSAGQQVSADVAVGDAFLGRVVYPVWELIHFGNNPEAAEKYGPRLFAAGTFTREERARIDANPALAQGMVREKKANYRAVAAEIEQAYPAAYAHLAGADTTARPGYAILGMFGVFPSAFVLACSLWWSGLLKLGLRLVVAVWPALALVTQFPTLQFVAVNMARLVGRFAVTAAAMIAVYVAFMAGAVAGILNAPAPFAARVAAMALLVAVGAWLWRNRGQVIYRRTGADAAKQEMRAGFEAMRRQVQRAVPRQVPAEQRGKPLTQHLAGSVRVVSAAVQRRPVKLAAEVAGVVANAKRAHGAGKAAKVDRSRPRSLTPRDWPIGEHHPNPAPTGPLPTLPADQIARHTTGTLRKEKVNAFTPRRGD